MLLLSMCTACACGRRALHTDDAVRFQSATVGVVLRLQNGTDLVGAIFDFDSILTNIFFTR